MNLERSNTDLPQKIKTNQHATLITEIKFSSPSLGRIRTTSDPAEIAKSMVSGGASAISVLTQPYMFGGSPDYFILVRRAVNIPILMKDIIIDKVQIDAAQKLGADYILLIQSIFDHKYLADADEFVDYAHKRNLGVLIESHTSEELKHALETDADLIGVNNRNLDTLDIDLDTTRRLLSGYGDSRPVISESGIDSPSDIISLKRAGADAFLVGSSLMKTDNIQRRVKDMVNAY